MTISSYIHHEDPEKGVIHTSYYFIILLKGRDYFSPGLDELI